MHLFLDANVYLSFYHFGKDDIETMHKVVKLIKDGEIILLSNSHLRNEIERNRHGKINDGFKPFAATRYGREFPNYCNSYEKFEELTTQLKKVNKIHRELVVSIENDIKNRNLEADNLIESILEASTEIPIDDEIIQKAKRRVELGNPPGKSKSLGDAIHWECLLSAAPYQIWFVSKDGDFASQLYPNEINPFLSKEWESAYKIPFAEITLFETLSSFLSSKFPEFELSVEAQKDELIENLSESASFAGTHEIVGNLLQFGSFTAAQSRRLCNILVGNNQVYLIAGDGDIQTLFNTVKSNAWFLTDADTIKACETRLGWPEHELGVPF